ncbi:MAG: LPP20 family lipoprotein [Treponema sp.]|nr:LPP20 family lipoprotein [Treponema sp.]
MRKCVLVLFALLLAFAVIGCKSAPEPAPASAAVANPNLPDFVLNPPVQEDAIFGIGSAKLSNLNQSMSMAEARARQSLAFQLNANVKAMITDYARDAGTADSTTALQLSEQIGRQLTQTTLAGAMPVKREQTPDGTWWVLVSYSKSAVTKATSDAMKGIVDNEAARYAEFKAMDALKLMDAQLDKMDTKPEIVAE